METTLNQKFAESEARLQAALDTKFAELEARLQATLDAKCGFSFVNVGTTPARRTTLWVIPMSVTTPEEIYQLLRVPFVFAFASASAPVVDKVVKNGLCKLASLTPKFVSTRPNTTCLSSVSLLSSRQPPSY